MYKYFVSFSHSGGNGMMEINLKKKIKSFEQLSVIKNDLDEKLKDNCVILNYIYLGKDWRIK